MLHRHQAFFVFVDFVVSLAMLAITILALNGTFNKTIEVKSCVPTPVATVAPTPSATPSSEPSATPVASSSGLLKRVAPSVEK